MHDPRWMGVFWRLDNAGVLLDIHIAFSNHKNWGNARLEVSRSADEALGISSDGRHGRWLVRHDDNKVGWEEFDLMISEQKKLIAEEEFKHRLWEKSDV